MTTFYLICLGVEENIFRNMFIFLIINHFVQSHILHTELHAVYEDFSHIDREGQIVRLLFDLFPLWKVTHQWCA